MTEFSRGVRNRMLLRSFTIQGSWNYETLIGTGFGYTILPALRFLHGREGPALEDALRRHVELFNSHPYVATVAVGAVATLEERGVDPAVIHRFKTALRGSLGSIGDRLVWSTWRPMSVLIALLLILLGAAWWLALMAFFLVYNGMHLAIRTLGLNLGISAGLEVGARLRSLPLQRVIEGSSQVGCALVGAAAVVAASPAVGDGDPIGVAAVAVAVVLGLTLGFRTRSVMTALVAGVAAIALILGTIGYGA